MTARCASLITILSARAENHLSILDPLWVCSSVPFPPVLRILGVAALKEYHLHMALALLPFPPTPQQES